MAYTKGVKKPLILIFAVTVAIVFFIASRPQQTPAVSLETRVSEEAEVSVSVTPTTLKKGFPASFDVAFETHSVDLTFDVEKIATLTDGMDNVYTPYWNGSPPGGHHRSGTLRFTPDLSNRNSVTLTLKNIAGIPARTFTWERR